MNIVCCTDHKYIMPTGVMICSICVNHPNCEICFHVVCNNDVTESDKNDLREITLKHSHKIEFYEIKKEIADCFTVGQKGQNKHITISTYYRLFLAEILPTSIDKVIYLDADVIVRNSLLELYKTDLNGLALGVVTNMSEGNIQIFNRLRYSPTLGYFNAGVLLINLHYWRNENLLEQFTDYAIKYPDRILWHDQDLLNYVLKNSKKQLPLTYNFQNGFLYKERNLSWEYDEEIRDTIRNPIILHFTGDKPWQKGCNHPYKGEFFKYQKMTKWANIPLWKARPISWKIKIRKLLIYAGILKASPYTFASIPPLSNN